MQICLSYAVFVVFLIYIFQYSYSLSYPFAVTCVTSFVMSAFFVFPTFLDLFLSFFIRSEQGRDIGKYFLENGYFSSEYFIM